MRIHVRRECGLIGFLTWITLMIDRDESENTYVFPRTQGTSLGSGSGSQISWCQDCALFRVYFRLS